MQFMAVNLGMSRTGQHPWTVLPIRQQALSCWPLGRARWEGACAGRSKCITTQTYSDVASLCARIKEVAPLIAKQIVYPLKVRHMLKPATVTSQPCARIFTCPPVHIPDS